MKKELKINGVLKNSKLLSINDLNFELESPIDNVELDVIHHLIINVSLSNFKVVLKEYELDDIKSIIEKIDKYQKGKMSEKEVQKVVNKLIVYPHLEPIVYKMQLMDSLDNTELVLLNSSLKNSNFVAEINHSNIILNEMFIHDKVFCIYKDLDVFIDMLVTIVKENMMSDENQDILSILFEEQERQRIEENRQKIMAIMGSSKPKNNLTKEEKVNKVDNYLKEKQKMIEENSETSYFVDVEFPLPQANNLERVIELGKDIFNRGESKINLEVLENDLDKRDVHYYSRALCYLKLAKIDESSRDLCLTYEGEKFFRSSEDEKKDIIFSILNTDPLVKLIINNNLDLNNADHRKEFEGRGLSSDSTIVRRIASLKSWIVYLSN